MFQLGGRGSRRAFAGTEFGGSVAQRYPFLVPQIPTNGSINFVVFGYYRSCQTPKPVGLLNMSLDSRSETHSDPVYPHPITLDRMVRAVEKVRLRLLRAVKALEADAVLYAVIGGNAVAAWVSRIDEAAVRNTQDVIFCCGRKILSKRK